MQDVNDMDKQRTANMRPVGTIISTLRGCCHPQLCGILSGNCQAADPVYEYNPRMWHLI